MFARQRLEAEDVHVSPDLQPVCIYVSRLRILPRTYLHQGYYTTRVSRLHVRIQEIHMYVSHICMYACKYKANGGDPA